MVDGFEIRLVETADGKGKRKIRGANDFFAPSADPGIKSGPPADKRSTRRARNGSGGRAIKAFSRGCNTLPSSKCDPQSKVGSMGVDPAVSPTRCAATRNCLRILSSTPNIESGGLRTERL